MGCVEGGWQKREEEGAMPYLGQGAGRVCGAGKGGSERVGKRGAAFAGTSRGCRQVPAIWFGRSDPTVPMVPTVPKTVPTTVPTVQVWVTGSAIGGMPVMGGRVGMT